MTLNSLASEILQEQGEKLGDTALVSQVEIWTKDAITQLSIQLRQRVLWKTFTFNTVVGISLYDLPAEFREFRYVRLIEEDDALEYVSPKRLSEFGFDLEETGKPSFWWNTDAAVVGANLIQRIRLHPKPDSIYMVEAPYQYNPANLTSVSVIPLTDAALILLKSRVRMRLFSNDKDWEAYNAERGQYTQDLGALLAQERIPLARNLVRSQVDLSRKSRRSFRLRYPFE